MSGSAAEDKALGLLNWSLKCLLALLALAFLFLAGWLLYHAGKALGDFEAGSLETRTVAALSDALLAVIVVELAETIRQQLERLKKDKNAPPLSLDLVRDLLVIGIVAGVRHLLAVSAQLTFTPPPALPTPSTLADSLAARRSLMLELGLTAIVVVVLTAGRLYAGKFRDN